MKSLLFLATITLAFCGQLTAQSATPVATNPYEKDAAAATAQLQTKYHLNETQVKQVQKIQERKLRNLAEILPLKSADKAKYELKLRNLQQGTLGSLRKILVGKAQVDLYQKTQAEVRRQKSAKRKELTKASTAKADIDTALLDIYAE